MLKQVKVTKSSFYFFPSSDMSPQAFFIFFFPTSQKNPYRDPSTVEYSAPALRRVLIQILPVSNAHTTFAINGSDS